MKMLPVVFDWRELRDEDGELFLAMVPQERYRRVALRQFAAGEEYPLVVLEARSRRSHNAYFAQLGELFDSLPEDRALIVDRVALKIPIPPDGWINEDHFRKWCLCETNWCDVEEFDYASAAEARRGAIWYRKQDAFASITVRGVHVTIRTPLSQSAAAMQKQAFEDSKRDVLDLASAMVGVTRTESRKHSKRGAA